MIRVNVHRFGASSPSHHPIIIKCGCSDGFDLGHCVDLRIGDVRTCWVGRGATVRQREPDAIDAEAEADLELPRIRGRALAIAAQYARAFTAATADLTHCYP